MTPGWIQMDIVADYPKISGVILIQYDGLITPLKKYALHTNSGQDSRLDTPGSLIDYHGMKPFRFSPDAGSLVNFSRCLLTLGGTLLLGLGFAVLSARAAENSTTSLNPTARHLPPPVFSNDSPHPTPLNPDPSDQDARTIYESIHSVPMMNDVDPLVFAPLSPAQQHAVALCSDAVFIRRVYFDITGTLPPATEVRTFLASTHSHRRQDLIDRLLASDACADYHTMKWCELLRVKSEVPINLWPNAVQAYHRWIYTAVKSHMPYDRFARELLTSSGANFRVPAVNFYRAVQKKGPLMIAQAVGLTFMGVRTERWPQERLYGLAAFFTRTAYKSTTEWKEEVVYDDPDRPMPLAPNGRPFKPLFPDGARAKLNPSVDPRITFADWLISPKNPWFARALVNRVWFWHLGQGLVHEPDDIRDDNPPQNPKLLVWLEKDFVSHGYDLTHLCRTILQSSTYQLSSLPADPAQPRLPSYARYRVRQLEAEVLIDALCRLTGSTESYSSPIPEPFTYIPENQRSVELPDGSITSAFLDMFGRPSRDTGYEMERNRTPTAAQRVHLLNSSHIQNKLKQYGPLRRALAQAKTPEKQAEELYLAILSRHPTEGERRIAVEYITSKERPSADSLQDVAWALINSSEFIFKH